MKSSIQKVHIVEYLSLADGEWHKTRVYVGYSIAELLTIIGCDERRRVRYEGESERLVTPCCGEGWYFHTVSPTIVFCKKCQQPVHVEVDT